MDMVTSYLVSRTGPSFVYCGYLIHCIYHIIYDDCPISRCRVNQGTNMFVVFVM